MGEQFSISELGIKLIKTYEGFYADVRQLPSYGHVIGYGHRTNADDARTLSRADAEMVLREDLIPIEALINDVVHAPLTQSQFDALCSLVFNIGQTAFLGSDLLEALNNGRTLDAASGFDAWRKSAVNGKVYIIDALVRRRTAEKALFLRPEGRRIVASRIDVVPMVDETVTLSDEDDILALMTEDEIALKDEVISDTQDQDLSLDVEIANDSDILEDEADTSSHVLEVADTPAETDSDDVEALEMTSDNLVDNSDAADVNPVEESTAHLNIESEDEDMPASPIAEAAAEVVERLDALIETDMEDLEATEDAASVALERKEAIRHAQDHMDEDISETDVQREANDPVAANLTDAGTASVAYNPQYTAPATPTVTPSRRPLYIMMALGMVLMIGLFLIMRSGSENLLGEYGHFISMAGFLIGAMVFLGSLYTYLKSIARARQTVFQA